MVIAVAITTAPRPQPTLDAALESLRLAGYLDPVLIVADGDVPTSDNHGHIDITVLRPRRGIVKTWVYAVKALLDTPADALMVMQDDVTWPEGRWPDALEAFTALLAHDPQLGYASLHTMPRVDVALSQIGSTPASCSWHETGTIQKHLYKQRWCGAQCWVLPRASAVHLLADSEFQAFTRSNDRGFDHQVTLTLNRLGHRTYTWWPSLLSHDLGKGNRAPRQRSAA